MTAPPAEAITITADLGGGAAGYVVVDTTVQNASSGGLRVAPDLSVEEVATLAREMTLKFSFIGRPSGGAKSGLRIPAGAGTDEKRQLLRAFGRHIGPLIRKGIYSPGTDMNCGPDDLRAVYAGAGLRLGTPTDTALFTAIGAASAVAACREALGSPRARLRIAVEGFGAVAAWLAARLSPEEYVFTAVSTAQGAAVNEGGFDAKDLAEKKKRLGDALVNHVEGAHCPIDALFGCDVDLFIPSARTWSITAERARSIRAKVVVPLANAPYADRAVDVLEGRGVTCLPGFVVNSGGIFGSSLFDSGVRMESIERLAAREFRAVVRALLDARARTGLSPVELARDIALERLERRKAEPPESSYVRIARTLVRRNLPRRMRGAQYLGRFTQNLVELEALVRARAATATLRRTGT